MCAVHAGSLWALSRCSANATVMDGVYVGGKRIPTQRATLQIPVGDQARFALGFRMFKVGDSLFPHIASVVNSILSLFVRIVQLVERLLVFHVLSLRRVRRHQAPASGQLPVCRLCAGCRTPAVHLRPGTPFGLPPESAFTFTAIPWDFAESKFPQGNTLTPGGTYAQGLVRRACRAVSQIPDSLCGETRYPSRTVSTHCD
jgi:hypothetical protein